MRKSILLCLMLGCAFAAQAANKHEVKVASKKEPVGAVQQQSVGAHPAVTGEAMKMARNAIAVPLATSALSRFADLAGDEIGAPADGGKPLVAEVQAPEKPAEPSRFARVRGAVGAALSSATSAVTTAGSKLPLALSPAGAGVVAKDVVLSALSLVGVPYRWGGESYANGFDCSGFVRTVFKSSLEVELPRTAWEQAQEGQKIAMEDLKPGDLVFFNTMRRAFSHVGIYLGDNKFVHAPRTGARIQVADMDQSYWRDRFNGARRVSDGEESVKRALEQSRLMAEKSRGTDL